MSPEPIRPPSPVRALSLLSGGLDSRLAVCVLRDQGIEVHGVVFDSPFFSLASARAASEQLKIPLHVVDFTADIVKLLDRPPHGFGRCMNPCIDCHARMLNRAGGLLAELGFHFLATGEVLNERPMSQNRRSLDIVAADSGYPDLILRPLSAKCLPETRPEREGWVDRSRLLALEGRNRKPQMELARHYGLTDYPTPAGGCRLTEPNFCQRLHDLQQHEGLGEIRDLIRLRFGRHFRLADRIKLIVGRNQADNQTLEADAQPDEWVLRLLDYPGPTGLLPGAASESDILLAASICARYGDGPAEGDVGVEVRSGKGGRRIAVRPAEPEAATRLQI